MPEIGPVHILVVAFPEPHFTGRIVEELRKLNASNTVRVVDAVFVEKDADGTIAALEVEDLTDEEAETLGDLAGALVGLGEAVVDAAAMPSDDDIWDLAEDIPAGSAAAIVMLEHTWAAGLAAAVAEAGGELVDDEIISPSELEAIGADFAAEVIART